MKPVEAIIQDNKGRILGRMKALRRPNRREQAYIEKFLIPFFKSHREQTTMAEKKDNGKNERANMVMLAGTVESVRIDGVRGFCLIKWSEKESDKFVPCSIYDEKALISKLETYEKGDFIKVVGFCRPWSQKKNDEWRNSMDIRITEIRSEAPKREKRISGSSDNDWPF